MTRYPALAPLHPAIPAADGLILRGNLTYPHGRVGSRYPLAVLAHQYPSTRDSWAPFTQDLHALGVATLVFDMRGQGESVWTTSGTKLAAAPAEPNIQAFGTAFMASASNIGFSHIPDDIVRVASWGVYQNFIDPARLLLVGASVGGSAVLLSAPRLAKQARGIITFGAAGAPAIGAEAQAKIREQCKSVDTPMLLTSSEKDPFGGADHIREWGKGLKHVGSEIVRGEEHGMAIYYEVRSEVLAFVKKHVAVSRASRPVRR